jgi:hypothetical protein
MGARAYSKANGPSPGQPRHGIPAEKYYALRPSRSRAEDRTGNLDDLLTLWEERFEMDMASLIEQSTDNDYEPKFEGWDYSRARNRSLQQISCRIAFVSAHPRDGSFVTYEFFPFLDNKAVAIAPSEPQHPARIRIDSILTGVGYTVVEK